MEPKASQSAQQGSAGISSMVPPGNIFPSLAVALVPTLLSVLYFYWDTFLLRDVSHKISANVIDAPQISVHNTTGASNATIEDWMDNMWDSYDKECPKHNYGVRIFSHDPLIIYLENFITEAERTYLIHTAEGVYAPSGLIHPDGKHIKNVKFRSSDSATVYYDDPVGDCIKTRSALFQGNAISDHIEPLQVVRYKKGQYFNYHTDWHGAQENNPRITTIFAYLACDSGETGVGNCVGGPTQFPHFPRNFLNDWCDVVDCNNGLPGVGFKPVAGNAVFWSNTDASGTEFHEDTLHAGIPVKSGRKIGLNIWTRWTTYNWETDNN